MQGWEKSVYLAQELPALCECVSRNLALNQMFTGFTACCVILSYAKMAWKVRGRQLTTELLLNNALTFPGGA